MCGRYTLSTPGDEIARVFGLSEGLELEPRFNIAPTQQAPIVREERRTGRRVAAMCRWGLVPYWVREDVSIGDRMINARAETAADKPAYREAFRRRRCLVVADGFYEWRREGRYKQPFFFSRDSAAPFAMAGLWDRWSHGKEPLESFTVVTTDANDDVSDVHDRMPVILAAADWPLWLNTEDEGTAAVHRLLRPPPNGSLERRPVSTLVNSPANDSSRCVEAIDLASSDGDPQTSLF